MKRLIILVVLICGLVIVPNSAFTQDIKWADIFITPNGDPSVVGGFLGGDGNTSSGFNDWIDWSIGNKRPFCDSVTDDIVFSTNVGDFMNPGDWKERMWITKDGNVGIGTAEPAVKLDVYGRVRSGGYPPNDTTANTASTFELRNRGAGGGDYIWSIYTAAVGGGFGVNPNSFEIWEYPQDDTPGPSLPRFRILESGSQTAIPSEVVIDRAGNVGIGNTAPNYKLDVEGYVQAQGYYTGDITFQKDGQKLWRMFEDEEGLYLESLKTGKVYRFMLTEVVNK